MSRYRVLNAAFVLLFAVFAVGVPVVLASCPMMAAGSTTLLPCCADRSDGAVPTLSAYKNTSCCATKILASRNTQEFLPHTGDAHAVSLTQCLGDASILCQVTPAPIVTGASYGEDRLPPGTHPPLHLLYSNLLI